MYGKKSKRQPNGNEIFHSSLKVGRKCKAFRSAQQKGSDTQNERSPRAPMVPAYLQRALEQQIDVHFLVVHS